MNKTRVLFLWTICALTIEIAIFGFFNFVYGKGLSINGEQIININSKPDEFASISVPKDMKNFYSSYSGRYISYYSSGDLYIVDTRDGSKKTVNPSKGTTICYTKWLPDVNRILLCERSQNRVKFYHYDAAKDFKTEMKDLNLKPLELNLSSKSEQIEKVSISTKNTRMTFKVSTSSNQSKFYGINIQSQLERLSTVSTNTKSFDMFTLDGNVIYESSGKIRQSGYKQPLNLGINSDMSVLGIDYDNKIYTAVLDGDNVSSICSFDLEKGNVKNKKTINLPFKSPEENIKVLSVGGVFLIDSKNNKVIDVLNNKPTSYKGDFMSVFKGGIYSLKDNKLIKTTIK